MTILQDEIIDRVTDEVQKEVNEIRLLLGLGNDRSKTPREAIRDLIMERDVLLLHVKQLVKELDWFKFKDKSNFEVALFLLDVFLLRLD